MRISFLNKQLWSVMNQTNYRVFDRFDVCNVHPKKLTGECGRNYMVS